MILSPVFDPLVGLRAVWRRDLALVAGAFEPLDHLLHIPVGRARECGYSGRRRRIVVGCLADDDGRVEPAGGEDGVGMVQSPRNAGRVVVHVQLDPAGQREVLGLEGLQKVLEPPAPIARARGRDDGDRGAFGSVGLDPAAPDTTQVGPHSVPLGGRGVIAGRTLVEKIESDLRGPVLQREGSDVLDEGPVLLETCRIVVVAKGTVGPLRAERNREAGEAEAARLGEIADEVAPVRRRQASSPRRHDAPVLSRDVSHVPDDDAQGLDAGDPHGSELMVDGGGYPNLVVGVEDPVLGPRASVEGVVGVVGAHQETPIGFRHGGGIVGFGKAFSLATIARHGRRQGDRPEGPSHLGQPMAFSFEHYRYYGRWFEDRRLSAGGTVTIDRATSVHGWEAPHD